MKQRITDFKVGDTVRVHQKIVEGGKERIQVFEGVVIKTRAGKNVNGTFTVRKISEGVGVERTFLVHSPRLAKIEVIRRGKVRRANLSYLRNLRGKKARLKEKQFDALVVNVDEEKEKVEMEKLEGGVKGQSGMVNSNKQLSEDSLSRKDDGKKKDDSNKNDVDEEKDKEITELKAEDEEDEEKLKEISTEKLAELERKASERVHRLEEENIEKDETGITEEEVDFGLEKAEDEDTRNQEKKK